MLELQSSLMNLCNMVLNRNQVAIQCELESFDIQIMDLEVRNATTLLNKLLRIALIAESVLGLYFGAQPSGCSDCSQLSVKND